MRKQADVRAITTLLKELRVSEQRIVLDFVDYLRYRRREAAGVTAQITESLHQIKTKKLRPARTLLG